MAEPRYSETLKKFIHDWRPNDPELDKRFMADVRELLAAILKPPGTVFEVSTILTPDGGRVTVRVGDYETQIDPLDAQHLGLSLMEGAASARLESFLSRFLIEQLGSDQEHLAFMLAHFRHYRMEQMQAELDGNFEKRSVLPKDAK